MMMVTLCPPSRVVVVVTAEVATAEAAAAAVVMAAVATEVEATEAVVKGTAVEEAVEREGLGGGTKRSHSIACIRRLSKGLMACGGWESPPPRTRSECLR